MFEKLRNWATRKPEMEYVEQGFWEVQWSEPGRVRVWPLSGHVPGRRNSTDIMASTASEALEKFRTEHPDIEPDRVLRPFHVTPFEEAFFSRALSGKGPSDFSGPAPDGDVMPSPGFWRPKTRT